jgi:hypothetical protein
MPTPREMMEKALILATIGMPPLKLKYNRKDKLKEKIKTKVKNKELEALTISYGAFLLMA